MKYENAEAYLLRINADPDESIVKTSKDGDFRYVPISATENLLDEIYMGSWSWSFTREVVGREYAIGKGDVSVQHPVTGAWISRSGTAAVPFKKNMEMDYPLLEALTLLSAARKIGRVFGRDLNRGREDEAISDVQIGSKEEEDPELQAAIAELKTIEFKEEAEQCLQASPFRYNPILKGIVSAKPTK